MIHCKLKGGLGNMMFQIAGALSIAIDKKTEANFFNLDDHLLYLNRDIEYNPKLNYAEDYKKINIFKKLKSNPISSNLQIIRYPFHYETRSFLSSSDVLIDGFFQSEKYFLHNEESIRAHYEIDSFIKKYVENKYSDAFSFRKLTSIHIRRGDYLSVSKHHPPLGMNYFKQAINETLDYTNRYVVFSDDIEWCKTKFQGNKFIFVDSEKDYVELYFMSLCNNHIISNSSFSWWGSWLNPNKNKKVICPKQWFGPAINESTVDLIPSEWIII